ncbi:sugar ABC transporter permease [Planomonospora sp. ID91781]|uniref:ABC transporter permease n=3 Tax=Planomonospora TaxID=1998 RepID=A0A171B0B4_9ACTN|nr:MULTISPECIES: sugar ABC transporter permease [Planomonospora]MBG0822343.1 sugar ABC transporter permease [Planomonospora sp. ID91781]GAT64525.1 ABC transporter permease [Planomonospora sphaerica]GGK88572.1 ABC transporter permease [Planomonospora parontospora]GII11576.1 ABC transporter permease [Planomonospora parontospora subsp. parontospora]
MTLNVDTPAPARREGPRRSSGPRNPGRGGRGLARFDLRATPYFLVSPYFLLFAVFGLFPLGYTAWVSLHDWELAGDKTFTGLDNYTELIADGAFWNAVLNTVGIFVIATIPQLVLALMLANALNKRIRGRLFFRLGILLPLVTSVVAVAVVFTQLYGRDYGMINWFLSLFGVEAIEWQNQSWSAWIAIATMIDWRWTGYNAIILLAAMQTIPKDLYEAASLDGASARRQFWQITVPMLRPTLIFVVFVSTIGGLTLFAEPVMFEGNPTMAGGATGQYQTVAMFIVKEAFRDFDMGYASAAAWLLFALILIGILINYSFTRRIGGKK